MNIVFVKFIGGFVHWLIHGCKTSLKDEVEGRLEATWGSNYDMENYLIGFATAFVILVIVFGLVF